MFIAKYLKLPTPNSAEEGDWYVRNDGELSPSLPWVPRPVIGDGNLVGDVGFDPLSLSKSFDVSW